MILAPVTTEMKDRMWTYTKSTLVENAHSLHPERKHIVLDGRLRSDVREGRGSEFFFMVERATDKKTSNMEIVYPSSTVQVETVVPGLKDAKKQRVSAEKLPQIPVMMNPKTIKKGTKLLCYETNQLENLHKKLKAVNEKDAAVKKGAAINKNIQNIARGLHK